MLKAHLLIKATIALTLLLMIPGFVYGEIWLHKLFEISGEDPSSGFAISTSGAGDYDGDGHGDVIVGEYLHVFDSDTTGAAYLFFGNHSRDCLLFNGFQNGEKFGYLVESAGDFNGDGYDDLLISAPEWRVAGSRIGRVFLYFGGDDMDTEADLVFSLPAQDGRFGTSAAGIGDINQDFFDDIIIGSPYAFNMAGFFAIYLGDELPDAVPDCIVVNEHLLNGRLGFSTSQVGDLNSDGFLDFAVCMAPKRLSPPHEERIGEAWIYYGGKGLPESPDLVFKGVNTSQLFGFSVQGAGDFDGDGFGDVMVGAPRINSYPPRPDSLYDNGAVFIYSGGAYPDTTVDLIIFGEEQFDGFGSALYAAGDLDGDGFDDIIVGAPENDEGGIEAGACYLFLGNNGHEEKLLDKILGHKRAGQFGYCLSAVDRPGSERLNFLIGSPGTSDGFCYEYLNVIPIRMND